MELIIKPTEKCNFKCTFCSSTHLTDDKTKTLDLDLIFQFLERFPETHSIIVNGGDPLMVPRDYYFHIIEHLEKNNLPANLSFTSNLWGFYQNPNYWTELLKHPRVGVTTSFNYGETRRISVERNYTEDIFWKVSDLFLERIGYRPGFISVINYDNYETAIDNVHLAKRMNVECKLNYSVASGEQSLPFLKGYIYKTYLDIIDQGLAPWEYNAKQILAKEKALDTTCPLSRNCDQTIRCLQPNGDYYSCGSFGDDKLYPIDFQAEVQMKKFITPLSTAPELRYMKESCLACPLFSICNGCRKTIHDVKKHDLVEKHCSLMQENMGRLVAHLQ
jgi:radical SAM protein with 4Fe4S-binding SPASM domain